MTQVMADKPGGILTAKASDLHSYSCLLLEPFADLARF
jgi:hypothetical protein